MKKILIFIILISIPALATDFIEERKTNFRENKDSMKLIYSGIQSNDFNLISEDGKKIALWAEKMHEYFPPGSVSRGSSETIWENFEQFKNKAKDNKDAATNLVLFAAEKNLDKVKSSFSQLSDTCKSCHRSFKN